MPLIKSKSKKAQKENIEEIIENYKKTGKIGESKSKSKEKAIKQAVAISYKIKRGKK